MNASDPRFFSGHGAIAHWPFSFSPFIRQFKVAPATSQAHNPSDSPAPSAPNRALSPRRAQRLRQPKLWRWGAIAGGLLLLTDWKLMLAAGAGGAVWWLSYWLREHPIPVDTAEIRRWLKAENWPVLLAAGSGSVVAVSTYLAIAIWSDTDSFWLASGIALQGLGTLTLLALLAWQVLGRRADRAPASFDRAFADLAAADPLQRLVAVRQLSQMAEASHLDAQEQRMLADALRLMLRREQEPIVRAAALESFRQLPSPPALAPSQRSPVSPLQGRREEARSRQPVS